MGKLVILELDGDLRGGLRVTLDWGDDGDNPAHFLRLKGSLPANPGLAEALQTHWVENYRNLSAPYRIKPTRIKRHVSVEACRASARALSQQFNAWLDSPDFRPLDKRLRQELAPTEDIRLLVRTSDLALQKLPWPDWELVQGYPRAEPAIAPLEAKTRRLTSSLPRSTRVWILAVLGHAEGIDVEGDRHFLETLPAAAPRFLVQPSHAEVIEALQGGPWDIIFFAGHSETEGDTGRIHLNAAESLTVDELWYSLRKAVDRGLHLAIFNSCDGLGLAQRLDELAIPQMIVMRELVPDQVAQRFLTRFLGNFAAGLPLYTAVREARQCLHDHYEREFPGAGWLPVICQGVGMMPLTWEELYTRVEPAPEPVLATVAPPSAPALLASRRDRWQSLLLATALTTGLVTGTRLLGLWQAVELYAFDHLTTGQPAAKMDDRFLLITIGEADIQYQLHQGMALRHSLSPEALELLWQKLAPYQPRLVSFSILDFKYDSQRNVELLSSPQVLIACQHASPDDDLEAVVAPAGLAGDRLGFINRVLDPDGLLRRQLLGLGFETEQPCKTNHALSLRVAEHYLQARAERVSPTELKLGQATLHKLSTRSGGYALRPSHAEGFQIPLWYRHSSPPTVSLADLISGAKDPLLEQLVRDKMVLVGRDRHGEDATAIPARRGRHTVPHIEVQANAIGQLIDAAQGKQATWRYLSEVGETILITALALVASASVFLKPSWQRFLASFLLTSLGLAACFFASQQLVWLPTAALLATIPLASGLASYCLYWLPRSQSKVHATPPSSP